MHLYMSIRIQKYVIIQLVHGRRSLNENVYARILIVFTYIINEVLSVYI